MPPILTAGPVDCLLLIPTNMTLKLWVSCMPVSKCLSYLVSNDAILVVAITNQCNSKILSLNSKGPLSLSLKLNVFAHYVERSKVQNHFS